jgi:hypothetical protein
VLASNGETANRVAKSGADPVNPWEHMLRRKLGYTFAIVAVASATIFVTAAALVFLVAAVGHR